MPHRTEKRQDADVDADAASSSGFELGQRSEPGSYSDSNSDTGDANSEGDYLRQRLAHHKKQGRAKSKRQPWSHSLVEREFQHWEKFCLALKNDPIETLLQCEADKFKTYLEWRMKNSRIKKESAIKAYWRRILCKFIDVAGHSMNNGVELDIQNWIPTDLTPTYKLDTSNKEKHAMYVRDLYTIINAHWTMDPKPRHGRFRVQMAAILLLCGATATRPQALVESSSAKGSNKALSYEHITIMKVRNAKNRNQTTTIALVDLVHIKNSGGLGRRKKFIFRLESIPAFCILSHLISLAIRDNAFRHHYTSPEEVYSLEIPAHKESLKVKFKKEIVGRPIFRDIEMIAGCGRVSDTKAFPYSKCREHFVWLGRVAGFEQSLELYQLRRASGRMLNTALTQAERNQTMGHHGDTYERFYMPDLIERDFQSIYFGTPSQDDLIQHAARMGISRDERAPTGLTEEQKLAFQLELDQNPEILRLREKRDRYKQKINSQGYRPIDTAKGTKVYERFDEARRKLNSLRNVLRRQREDQAILDFYDAIDDYDIERQLSDGAVADLPARPVLQYEFRERAAIAKLLSQPLDELEDGPAMKLRMKFMRSLIKYCNRQESRQDGIPRNAGFQLGSEVDKSARGVKRNATDTDADAGTYQQAKRQKGKISLESPSQEHPEETQCAVPVKDEEVEVIASPYPMTFTGLVCLLCIGDDRLSMLRRTRTFAKKDTLQKHLNDHVAEGVFKHGFHCKHPCCSEWIEGLGHFKNHAALVHRVWHPVERHY